MDEMQEILEDFLIEAFELIEQLDIDLVKLEHNPSDPELLNKIFRVAHTIKGSSSFLGFDTLTYLTHNMEDVLNKARHKEIIITPDIMDVILRSTSLMKELLAHIKEYQNDQSDQDIESCVQELQKISMQKDEKPKAKTVKKEVEPAKKEAKKELKKETKKQEEIKEEAPQSDDLDEEIARLLAWRQEQDRQKRASKKANTKPANKPSTTNSNKEKVAIDPTVRVDVKRLDSLMNLIGELVLGKNRLLRIYKTIEDRYDGEQLLEEFNQVVSSISMVTTDLQLAVMKTRMLPIGKVFSKIPRMVRDLSRELGKEIELIIEGEETELDKSIIEEIGDPLVHIIRNSCDHGIEMPDIRQEKGKPLAGTIRLSAYNEGNHIVINIQDDGKGLDADMLKTKAIQKGLITQEEADTMGEKEAYNLIFKPGFSTAAAITNVSGRGVGMDVVRANIEQLNGMIEIDSKPSCGMTLKLKIPLTLAIIQTLVVAAQEESYAIPLSSVLETVHISQDDICSIDGKSVLRLRDEVLSLVHLKDIFEVPNTIKPSQQAYVVIIGLGNQKMGIIVDELIGQEEIVIKSLGYYLKGTAGIAGASVRGDGKIILIIDVAMMIEMAKEVKASHHQATEQNTKTKASDYHILIVDDSHTDRALIKKLLAPLKITIHEASNGLEALEMIKSSEDALDGILVDIEMPKMDGYTLSKEIKKIYRFKHIPIIALTSKNTKDDRLRGIESGINEYLTKPCTQEYLIKIIRQHIHLPQHLIQS